MLTRKTALWVASLLMTALAVTAGSALAQSGGGYDLTWSTVDGGGYTFSTGGSYALGGTVGQADAGLLSGGSYTLGGGFWTGGSVTALATATPTVSAPATATPTSTPNPSLPERLYLPLVTR